MVLAKAAAILATGDLVQDETRAGYERFRDVLEKVAEAMGVDPADLLSNVGTAHE